MLKSLTLLVCASNYLHRRSPTQLLTSLSSRHRPSLTLALTKTTNTWLTSPCWWCCFSRQKMSSSASASNGAAGGDQQGDPPPPQEHTEEEGGAGSKKGAKKADKKAAKEARKAEREQQQAAAHAASSVPDDIFVEGKFGLLPVIRSTVLDKRLWSAVKDIDKPNEGQCVWIRARLQTIRKKSNKMAFMVFRQQLWTIQGVLCESDEAPEIPKDMIKWAGSLTPESVVDVYGAVTVPQEPVKSTTQHSVELKVLQLFCVSKAAPILPFQLEDASRSEIEFEKDPELVHVNQDVRLDNRILDLRTRANQAIFRIESMVCQLFREYLYKEDFVEIHTPKMLGGASEGGAQCFRFQYFNQPACLAQSPQLFKQMVLSGDMNRVFEIGPVFRAENSFTYRHLCEFTGLDMEMTFNFHYYEVLDVLEKMFLYIFKGLNERCANEIAVVHEQFPAAPFQIPQPQEGDEGVPKVPRIEFQEGVRMLREAGTEGVPDDISEFDLSTTQEKALGKLVKDKYNTDFYMLVRYPLKVRPFYSMPDPNDETFSNSYDFFMRGEEIVSGAQRIHCPDLLVERARAWGMEVDTIKSYIDSFKLGAYPHAGCGVGLERVVMLFLGLNNVRKTSLFPRDPKRLAP
ncbi:unnamed protein product [Vitrella brassicaformis CCMP3155]|uniref:aspartate--tRNA ligase n=1 Tax=Vitrella brassicaformis (strain CCMP3155) TaxID=1169540 RepID=A0A0G4ES45_VITBC|nr:unnamed protein product [Vitrella brassicaformis CCMP3155]|eukprot:CEM00869.1 unnamed protein product [Vitrella brassicaformis CCMP3155]